MTILEKILIIGTIVFGSLGYIKEICSFRWGKKAAWICLIAFLLLSIPQIIVDKVQKTKDVETINELIAEPTFGQSWHSMITGIPASMLNSYDIALDSYKSKDFDNAAKTIQSVITSYEEKDNWDLKEYSVKQHNEWVSEFYLLASKINLQLKEHLVVYEYSKKALKANTTYYTYYSLSVAAYNTKKYQESLENINKAINLTPSDSEYQKIKEQYQQIKKKCLNHLK